MKRVLYLVDTIDYVESNCFQQQLLRGFRERYHLTLFPVLPDRSRWLRSLVSNPQKFDAVVSVLRQRTLNRVLPWLGKFLRTLPVAIYDQDPWQSYIDDSTSKGVYHRVRDNLNALVFVTSSWWAEKLRRDGVRAYFVRMGMEPRWCDPGLAIHERETEIGFRGLVHPHRKAVFDVLLSKGISVEADARRLDYEKYLKYLQTLRVFAHDESAPVICDGEEISRSTGMWIKDIETAARGTFTLRDWHPEAETYDIDKIPTMLFYKHPSEAADVMAEFRKLSADDLRDRQIRAVDEIRNRNDWPRVAETMISTVSST